MKKLLTTLALCSVMAVSVILTGCGHEHTFEEAWTTDATHHWHKATCDHSDEKSEYGEHLFTDDYDTDCNTCGAPRIAPIDMWDETTAELPEAIDGVITIKTAEQLAGLAKAVNEGTSFKDVTIKLVADINLNNKEWTPIGYGSTTSTESASSGPAFNGKFDGNNHTIKNLKITTFKGGASCSPSNVNVAEGVGLFGNNNGTIKNIIVDGAVVKGNHFVGVIAGHNVGAVIDNCHVKNATVSGLYADAEEDGHKVGGVVGYVENSTNRNASVTNCSVSNSAIDAVRDAGQVIGVFRNEWYETEATQSGNTATNVTVSANTSAPQGYGRVGEHITNDIVSTR